MDLFNLVYFNNPIYDWGFALLIVVLFVVLSRISLFVSKNFLTKLTAKTKSDFDDILVDLMEEPFAFFIIVIGFVVAYQFLTFDASVNDFFFNAIKLLVMGDIAWFALRFTDSFFERIIKPITSKTKTKLDDQLIPWLKKALKAVIVFMAAIVILDNMGIDVMALLAGLGIGGIAFAFAAQKTIADAFGGVSILFSRPFIVGDTIQFSGGAYTGKVEEINLRYTKLRDTEKHLVVVPNSILAGEILTNITGSTKRKVTWHIGLTYDTSNKKIEEAKKIIISAIKHCGLCDDEFTVALEEFAQSSINILVIFYTRRGVWEDMVAARDFVGLEIKKEFEKSKIEMAFPTQSIYLKK
jgi:MscS family membrane protein